MALLRSISRGFWRPCCIAAATLALLAASGCHPWWSAAADSAVSPIADDAPLRHQTQRDVAGARSTSETKPKRAASDNLDPLSNPFWISDSGSAELAETIAAARGQAGAPLVAASISASGSQQGSQTAATGGQHHWRHPALEKLMEQSPDRRFDLQRALASSDPIAAANAAILLARAGSSAGDAELVRAIRSSTTNLRQRCAAAEALADVRQPATVLQLQHLVDEFGDFSPTELHNYGPELHADLLRSLTRAESRADVIPAGGEPRIVAALASPAGIVRREALLALADSKLGPLPANITRLATDEDRQVRAAAVVAIAARRHCQAMEVLRRALADQDLDVRLAAVAGYGLLGGADATAELKRLSTNSAELIRAAAYDSLVDGNDPDVRAAGAADKSWRVRRVVAAALARDSNRRSVSLAEQLVADGNLDVARQTIESVANWPLEQAGPVLMKAMSGLSYTPRKLAAAQLAARWPPAASFEVDAPADRRGVLLAEIERQWKTQFEAAAFQRLGHSTSASDTPEQAAENARELAAVERLKSDDLRERRAVAEDLRGEFGSRPLSEPALARLADLMTPESDPLVWASVFELLACDAREPSIRLAYGALGHSSPEVRRRACEHLAAHPDARHAPLLTISLADPDPAVVAAAVKALGRLNSLDDTKPLARLLADPDHELRVEVAKALAHAGADSGIAALERLAYDADPHVRRAVAAAMGEVPDASFLPDLIHLLDDRPEVCRAALASLPRVAGNAIPASDSTAAAGSSPESEPQRWKEWYRRQATIDLDQRAR
ncbi:MAG TPA: HEAT repeat domain-containing protein [Pirellulales bacterium]|nr:HEAT repeat domain-containing protein [Pirellulales bacterium]